MPSEQSMIDEMVWQAQYDAADATAESAGLVALSQAFRRKQIAEKIPPFQEQIFCQVRAKRSKAYLSAVAYAKHPRPAAGKFSISLGALPVAVSQSPVRRV